MKLKAKILCPLLILLCSSLFFLEIEDQPVAVIAFDDVQHQPVTDTSTLPTIMLDAGHGGYDSGSVGIDNTLEKDITLRITLSLGYYLSEAGFPIVYTRESDEVSWPSDNIEDLQTRVSLAAKENASYYISIHTNFSKFNDGAYGFESYLDYEDETIQQIASSIHEQLVDLDYSIDRGLKDTDTSPLYVIDQNNIPALLLEVGFLSDDDDASYIKQNPTRIAKAIADGIQSILKK